MKQIQLATTGKKTTRLGYGCSGLMGATNRRDSLKLLDAAYDAGIRHFDVAPMYGFGAAEDCLGEFLQKHPDELTVTTKFGIPPAKNRWLLDAARSLAKPLLQLAPGIKRRMTSAANSVAGGPQKVPFTAREATASLEHSLKQLRRDHIDLFLLHEAEANDLTDDALLRMLDDAVTSGKIGAFGVGSSADKISQVTTHRPRYCRVLQYEWSLLDSTIPHIPAFTIHHRALSVNFKALHQRLLTSPETCSRWSMSVGADLKDPHVLGALMLKASLEHNASSILLFSSRDPKHMQANAELVDDATLTHPALRLYGIVQNEAVHLAS